MPELSPILTELGLPGLVIGALGWAYWKTRSRLDEVLEQRGSEGREDAKSLADAMNASANAMQQNAQMLERLAAEIRARP